VEELKASCVQQQSVCTPQDLFGCIKITPENRVPHLSQMNSQLMAATGHWSQLESGTIILALDDLVMCQCLLAVLFIDYLSWSIVRIPSDR